MPRLITWCKTPGVSNLANLGMPQPLHKSTSPSRMLKTNVPYCQDKEDRILARKFNSYWNRYWHPIARAIELLQDPQERFAKPNNNETVAEPIRLMMQDKAPYITITQSQDKTPDTHEKDSRRPKCTVRRNEAIHIYYELIRSTPSNNWTYVYTAC